MTELQLSVMYTEEKAIQTLRLALDEFEQRHRIKVDLRVLNWDTAWSEMVRVALYRTGPDISEVGTTWVGSFVSTNALRPFSPDEVESLGGASIFLPCSWPETNPASGGLWGFPWLADTRLIFYRRDLLHQAGIDEAVAFSSFDQLVKTLDRLQAAGFSETPFLIPLAHIYVTFHIMASWVWANNGQFVSPGGKHLLFHMPEAQRGMAAYFNLGRYFLREINDLGVDVIHDDLFLKGQAAVIISGSWVLDLIFNQAVPKVVENFAMAVLPEAPFVGGTNLVIWRHTRHAEAAMKLVSYLTSKKVQIHSLGEKGRLPTRLDALNAPPFTIDPHYQVIARSLKTGRTFPSTRLWGLIEDKLAVAIREIWDQLLKNPDADTEQIIASVMDPLAKELNHALSG